MLEANSEPQSDCAVCRTRNIALKIDIHHATLKFLLDKVITPSFECGGLGMSDEVTVLEGDRYDSLVLGHSEALNGHAKLIR